MGEQKLGPTNTQTMLSMIQNGGIQSSTLVWRQGMDTWVPASVVPEFAYVLQNSGGISVKIGGDKREVALGLNLGGFILFIVLLFVCLPLCLLPWVLDSTNASR